MTLQTFCPACGAALVAGAGFCGNCGARVSGAGAAAAPPVSNGLDRAALRRQGLHFTAYPVWLMVVLSVVTIGIYTTFWLNHWHGLMPKRRPDDPSTAKAIWFMFIPIFNLYWLFESQLRLCTRLDEELAAAALRDRVPKELVRWYCITRLIPYVNLLVSPILAAIATGIMQSQVNRLSEFDSSSQVSA